MDGVAAQPTPTVSHAETLRVPALPPQAGLSMPRQSLWHWNSNARSQRRHGRYGFRRALIFGASAAMTLVAAYEMYLVLSVAGLTVAEHVVLALFVVLFAWLAFSTASAFAGF